jgi:RNase adaptor protein for sRNA GlmZ degradation
MNKNTRFIYCGDQYFVSINKKNYLMINKNGTMEFYLENDNELLRDHLCEMFQRIYSYDIEKFSEWVLNEYDFENDIEGFGNKDDNDDDDDDLTFDNTSKSYLYNELNKKATNDRQLKIYSFGKKYRRKGPPSNQFIFNACVLSGKKKGLNLKKLNGLDISVQKSVESSKNFDTFMTMIIEKIEKDNLTSVAICCSAGRHRSVTCCEILKNRIYQKSKIYHMELKKWN